MLEALYEGFKEYSITSGFLTKKEWRHLDLKPPVEVVVEEFGTWHLAIAEARAKYNLQFSRAEIILKALFYPEVVTRKQIVRLMEERQYKFTIPNKSAFEAEGYHAIEPGVYLRCD